MNSAVVTQDELTGRPSLPSRHPLVATQMVKEDLLVIALLLLVVNMHVPPWE